jgi:hypothetical protein
VLDYCDRTKKAGIRVWTQVWQRYPDEKIAFTCVSSSNERQQASGASKQIICRNQKVIMWKPGSSKPGAAADDTPPTSDQPKTMHHMLQSQPRTRRSSPKTPSSSRKRLSGATMNMNFMKRKKELNENEAKRRATMNLESHGTTGTSSSPPPAQQQQQQENGAAAVPLERAKVTRQATVMNPDETERGHYTQATSIDMYGMEAALIGRRSFRGFNPPIERAYQESRKSV